MRGASKVSVTVQWCSRAIEPIDPAHQSADKPHYVKLPIS
jgi:hypothetical protein